MTEREPAGQPLPGGPQSSVPPMAGPSLAGRSAWIFSDGKAGHEMQCLGVAAALGVVPHIKRVATGRMARLTAPWGPVARAERFGEPGSAFALPWPAIACATGRATIPYMRALRRRAGFASYTVILMDPRTGTDSADLIWVPEHDKLRGPNVVTTTTSPHRFSAAVLADLRAAMPAEIAALPRPRIAVLLGGPNGDYRYTADDEQRLTAALTKLAASGAGLMITPSRRTPPALLNAINQATAPCPRILWDGQSANPYAAFLAHADQFVVTADSVNMAGEAAATGRPVFVFTPAGRSAKFDRFHAALRASGAARPLPDDFTSLPSWTYAPLQSADVIAAEISRRWQMRASRLPGLCGSTP